MMFRLFLAALLTLSTPALADDFTVTGYPRVVDGDTLAFRDVKIRMHGIDAPESHQGCLDGKGQEYACGQVSTQALRDLIGDSEVVCKAESRDRYQRLIAICWAGKVNLNEAMVRRGFALAFVRYSRDYTAAEAEARRERLGVWQGEFVAPWDWRKRNK